VACCAGVGLNPLDTDLRRYDGKKTESISVSQGLLGFTFVPFVFFVDKKVLL
jgi:hypothetical protein